MLGGRVTLSNNLSFPNSQMYRLLVLKVVFHFTNSPRLFSPPLHLFYCCYKGRINFLAITPPPSTIRYVREVDLFRHDFTAKRLKCFKGKIIKTTVPLQRSLSQSWLTKFPSWWWNDFSCISSTNGMTLFYKKFCSFHLV